MIEMNDNPRFIFILKKPSQLYKKKKHHPQLFTIFIGLYRIFGLKQKV